VVYDVLRRSEEDVDGVFEEYGVVAVHVKGNGEGTPHIHILFGRGTGTRPLRGSFDVEDRSFGDLPP